MHEERNLNRAHEKYLEYAPQEPIDAMRLKGENVMLMLASGRGTGRSSAVRLRLCMAFNNLKPFPKNILLSKSSDISKSSMPVSGILGIFLHTRDHISVSWVSSRVPERPQWRMWTVWSYIHHCSCVFTIVATIRDISLTFP